MSSFKTGMRVMALLMLGIAAISNAAFAQGESKDRTHFGNDITVGPNEQVGAVTCFGCSIHIRGHVSGDATAVAGSVSVGGGGAVAGDLTSFGGNALLEGGSQIQGDVTVFGGRIRRDPGATIEGDITNFKGTLWALLIFGLPLIILGAFIALVIWIIRRLVNNSRPVPV